MGALPKGTTNKSIFLSRKRHIVFVCGGTSSRHARMRFLRYAKTELPNVTFFLAEAAEKDCLSHSNPTFLNLTDFEELVAAIADCIILFPETAGAIAELGLFSGSKDARKKLLVVIEEKYQSKDSFINRGPLATIDKESPFGPRVVLDLKNKTPNFFHIKEKLALLGKFRNRSAFKHETLAKMSKSEKLFVTLEIVNVFRALAFPEITELLTAMFSKPSSKEVRYLLSILVAAGYVTRKGADEEYFTSTDQPHSFFEYEGSEINDAKIEIIDFYQSTDPGRFNLLES